jgi:high-affinity iron transporter
MTGSLPMLSGGLVGIALGALVSAALYFGLLRIPMRYLFTATSWLITLLAAGMAAQGAGYLLAADVLPALGPTLWDTSRLLSDSSLVGQVLHTLVGYIDRPAGIQVLFYGLTVTSILVLTRALGEGGPRRLAVEPGRE